MIEIIPGIFESDEKELTQKITSVASLVPFIQIDIADKTLVPVETFVDAGRFAEIIKPFVQHGVSFEAHLMVEKPELYTEKFVRAGFSRIIGHVESLDPREFIADARTYECELGLAIDIETSLEVIEPMLEDVDFVLVMTAAAGASGQPFEESALSKIKAIRRNLPDMPIEVDCGINEETAKMVVEAGATRLVSTSYIFKGDIAGAIEKLRLTSGSR